MIAAGEIKMRRSSRSLGYVLFWFWQEDDGADDFEFVSIILMRCNCCPPHICREVDLHSRMLSHGFGITQCIYFGPSCSLAPRAELLPVN